MSSNRATWPLFIAGGLFTVWLIATLWFSRVPWVAYRLDAFQYIMSILFFVGLGVGGVVGIFGPFVTHWRDKIRYRRWIREHPSDEM